MCKRHEEYHLCLTLQYRARAKGFFFCLNPPLDVWFESNRLRFSADHDMMHMEMRTHTIVVMLSISKNVDVRNDATPLLSYQGNSLSAYFERVPDWHQDHTIQQLAERETQCA